MYTYTYTHVMYRVDESPHKHRSTRVCVRKRQRGRSYCTYTQRVEACISTNPACVFVCVCVFLLMLQSENQNNLESEDILDGANKVFLRFETWFELRLRSTPGECIISVRVLTEIEVQAHVCHAGQWFSCICGNYTKTFSCNTHTHARTHMRTRCPSLAPAGHLLMM